ncbi:hypothetical protein [Mucilaginibacter lappiensis]|jgi:hypothetical protein|uniref:hypothetical protein n=1 Tax=Mucilaginibacter lappiensis TaxID=354630 RepID=UPI003D1AA490
MRPFTKLILFCSIILSGCASPPQKVTSKKVNKKSVRHSIAIKNNVDKQDTLTVDSIAAVFTKVDAVEIEKRRKKYGDDAFYASADDAVYYSSQSHEYLSKQKLRIIDAQDQKFLKFVKADKTVMIIKLDTVAQLFNLYLFDPAKVPVNVDMTNIEDDYKKYFNVQ